MAAPAHFVDVLDSKTRDAAPGPRRIGLFSPQSVWLYALPVVELERTSPSGDWMAASFPDGEPREAIPDAGSGAAAERRRESGARDSSPELRRVEVPRPPRKLSSVARAALALLRGLGAVELDDRFTQTELKRAFRLLAMRLHPDRHPHASGSERARLARDFSTMTDAVGLLLASV